MSKTLYFAKVNLNSHIYNAYDNPSEFEKIFNLIYKKFIEDVKYVRNDTYQEEYTYTAEYILNHVNKLGKRQVVGSIIKKADIFVNTEINKETGEIKKVPIENNELIKFYYDIDKETVAFSRTLRFGHVEFCTAFEYLLNECMKGKKEDYIFKVSLMKTGVDINKIKSEISKLKNIETLRINIIPPNPDDELLSNIQQNGEKLLKSMKSGNITERSILFSSKAPRGLKLDSSEIQNELNLVSNIHSKLSEDKAIRNGYVLVEAKSQDGRKYSTDDNSLITNFIEDDDMVGDSNFANACKRKIAQIIASFM